MSMKSTKVLGDEYYESPTEKEAIVRFAYKIGIRKADKGVLYYDEKTDINKKCVLNKGIRSKNKVSSEFQGTFKDACDKYGVRLKELDKSKSGDRKKLVQLATKLVKQKLKENDFKYINKGSFDTDEDFIDGVYDTGSIYYISLWDITPNARSEFKSGEIDEKVEPMFKTIKDINNQKLLPSGYKLDIDGDWDDYGIIIKKDSRIKEDYNMNYEDQLDDLNEEFIQELRSYIKR